MPYALLAAALLVLGGAITWHRLRAPRTVAPPPEPAPERSRTLHGVRLPEPVTSQHEGEKAEIVWVLEEPPE